jgi:penicillin-binding protein 1A
VSPTPRRPGAARRPLPRRAVRTTLRAAVVTVVGVPLLLGVAASAAFGMLLYVNLPGTFPKARPPKSAQPSTVYDAAGNVIGTFRKFDLSVPMTESQVPTDLQNAVIANEDRKFWTHKGVDPEGMVRAALADYTSGKVEQGASTITQQYIRATYLNDEQTVSRKLNEAVLATRFERNLTKQLGSQHAAKERIMYLYLNTTYFGDGAYGAAAAAESYFHTDISHLSIAQAAALASIIPSPSHYSPRQDLFGAEQRRETVLGEMRDQGLITEAQYETAKAQYLWPAGFGDPGVPTTAFYPLATNGPSQDPYFVDYVRQVLTAKYGDAIYTDGLKIQTTIDPTLQAQADATEAKYMAKAPIDHYLDPTTRQEVANPQDMAIVTIDPATGYIKAMTGGRNYSALQLNLASGVGTQGMQPGSSFKAFTIATALEQGFTPAQQYPTPGSYLPSGCTKDSCAIHNDEGGSDGTVDMQTALTKSINTWFAQLARDVGPDNIQAMAKRLGVTIVGNQPCCDERITVGVLDVTPLSMASAYGVFDNHGVRVPDSPIVKVTKSDGTVLIDNTHPVGKQVLNPAIAETVAQLLKGPPGPGGTAAAHLASFGRPIAGKTGTTNDESDGWFVGFTPQLATAVWMGHDSAIQHLSYPGVGSVFGGTVPAAAWGDFMKLAVANLPPTDFPTPGPLPPPNSAADADAVLDPSARRPNRQTIPQLSTDCDGPCSRTTTLTTPPPPPTTTSTTTPPPSSSTTSTTTPRTSTTQKGHGQ